MQNFKLIIIQLCRIFTRVLERIRTRNTFENLSILGVKPKFLLITSINFYTIRFLGKCCILHNLNENLHKYESESVSEKVESCANSFRPEFSSLVQLAWTDEYQNQKWHDTNAVNSVKHWVLYVIFSSLKKIDSSGKKSDESICVYDEHMLYRISWYSHR